MNEIYFIALCAWSIAGLIIGAWAHDERVFDKPRPHWYKLVILVILMGPLVAVIFLLRWLVCIPVAYFLDWLSS